ncbi:hypothetical protein HDU89_003342 [Geranomyces variabilis]|nr:hypothetical protein HDU89_003342 [Geranomyces variabilis]
MEHSRPASSGTLNTQSLPPRHLHGQEYQHHEQQQAQEQRYPPLLQAPQTTAYAIASLPNPAASAPSQRHIPLAERASSGTALTGSTDPNHSAKKPQSLSTPTLETQFDHNAIRAALAAAAAAGRAHSPLIYSAIYSGVPVYEMVCKGTPVMRRMADGFMNATQILKVAGFTKAKRTKILEREVLPGPHEKIQGGYGKYQGTWIPITVSRALAARYHIENHLKPLFEFHPLTRAVAQKPSDMRSLLPERPPDSGNPSSAHGEEMYFARHDTLSGADTIQYPDSWELTAGQLLSNLSSASVAGGLQVPAPEIGAQVQALLQSLGLSHVLHSANGATGGGIDVDNFRARQEGASDDDNAAQAYIRNIQSILRSQDVQQIYQQLARTAAAAGEMGHPSTDPASVQTAYQQLALLNLLSMAAQHAYTAGYPSLEKLVNANTMDDGPPPSPMEAAYGKDSRHWRSGSSPERSKAPRPRSAHMNGDRGGETSEESEELYQRTIRQQNVITNMFLYGDSHLYQIIDSMKPSADAKKPDPNMIVDSIGSSLLHHAAQLGRAPLVEALLQNGANPAFTANGGETALMRSVSSTECHRLCSFEAIVRHLANTVYLADNNRRTVFHHAARAARDRDHWAAGGYYIRILANALIDEYADAPELIPGVANLQDSHDNTALHYACRSGNRNVARIILRLGADPDLKNHQGDTPVDVARYHPRLLAMIFRETDPNRKLGTHAALDSLDSVDQDLYASQTETDDEDEWVTDFCRADGDDSEIDDLQRSPSPEHGEKSIHDQTMMTLDGYYGERIETIMYNLIPDAQASNIKARKEIHQLRKSLISKSSRNLDEPLHGQENFNKARQKLENARESFSDLFERRVAMDNLSTLAAKLEIDLETRLVGDGHGTRRYSAMDQPTASHNATTDAGVGAVSSAAHSAPAIAAQGSCSRPGIAGPPNISDLKRKRSTTPDTADRRAANLSPPNTTGYQPETAISAASSPARLHTRSNRTYSNRLRTQLADLRARLSVSDRDRILLGQEIDSFRAGRETKDHKFKHLVAGCMKADVSKVEDMMGPLVKTEREVAE